MVETFNSASAFDQNLASWNVLRVSNFATAFDATALSNCNKMAMYTLWGATLQAAYPGFQITSVTVSALSPVNVQVSGVATITILGVDFSCSDVSPSAYRSGQSCATTSWTTNTQLVCAAVAPVLVRAGREAWVKVFTNTASLGFTFDGNLLLPFRS
jgi:hypothetical protein